MLPVSTTMILFQMNPFFVAILACVVLGERIRLIEIIGIIICFGGVVMIALSKAEEVQTEDQTADAVGVRNSDESSELEK